MVDLQAHAVGILEQDRVVAGGVGVVLGPVDDVRADPDQEGVDLVDIVAAAGPETDVVQPDRALLEAFSGMAGRRRLDAERGAPADAVIGAVGIGDAGQAQERQQLAVEAPRRGEIAGGDEGMRDAVDFLEWAPLGAIRERGALTSGRSSPATKTVIPRCSGEAAECGGPMNT